MSLAKALLAVQGEIASVQRDSTNPHFRSNYASLESVINTIRPACQKHGIVVVQAPGAYQDGVIQLVTTLVHAESDEKIERTMGLPIVKQDPQGVGSAITYACRYSLMAIFNLAPVDDDGNAASYSSMQGPKENKTVTNPAMMENLMVSLIAQVESATTKERLDKIKNDPQFKSDYGMLPQDFKNQVNEAGRAIAETLGA